MRTLNRSMFDTIAGRQHFIDKVASTVDPTTVPLHARSVLKNLAEGSFEKLSFLAGCLRSFLNKPARIDRSVRAASLLAIPLVLIALTVFSSLVAIPMADRSRSAALVAKYPDFPPLNEVLSLRHNLKVRDVDYAFVDIHLAQHYKFSDFSNFADYQHYRLLNESERSELLEATTQKQTLSSNEIATVDTQVNAQLEAFQQRKQQFQFWVFSNQATSICMFLMLGQLFTLCSLATLPGQHLFGFAVVDAKGRPAGRLRLLLRWAIAWSLFFFAFQWSPLLLIVWLIGLAYSIVRPTQGVHDWLSGCRLVPR